MAGTRNRDAMSIGQVTGLGLNSTARTLHERYRFVANVRIGDVR
jgi:hypothetical protein